MEPDENFLEIKIKFHWAKALAIFVCLPYFAAGFVVVFFAKQVAKYSERK